MEPERIFYGKLVNQSWLLIFKVSFESFINKQLFSQARILLVAYVAYATWFPIAYFRGFFLFVCLFCFMCINLLRFYITLYFFVVFFQERNKCSYSMRCKIYTFAHSRLIFTAMFVNLSKCISSITQFYGFEEHLSEHFVIYVIYSKFKYWKK